MSNDKTAQAPVAASTDAGEITTLNSHATIQPVKLTAAGDEGIAEATPDNSHATDETA
ncbi:hypothetical protein [Streptomyces sp. NPDC013455]|uniref:hypothetical protein n=1 Tax=Streptomyces sp. NPDC013455 TaxID=3155605 RepID=UPI0033EB9721